MLVDPAINLMTTGPDPKLMYAYESADPVEALSFPVTEYRCRTSSIRPSSNLFTSEVSAFRRYEPR